MSTKAKTETKANTNPITVTSSTDIGYMAIQSEMTDVIVPVAYNVFSDEFKRSFRHMTATTRLTAKFNLDSCYDCYVMKRELTTEITDSKARSEELNRLYATLGTDRTKFNRYVGVYERILSNTYLKSLTTDYSISALIELSVLRENQLFVLFGLDERVSSRNYAKDLKLDSATVADIKTVVKEIKPIENDMNIHNALTAMLNYFENNGKYTPTVEVKPNKDSNNSKDGNDSKDGTPTTTTTTNKTAVDVLLTLGDKAFENIDVKDIKALADLVTKALTAHTPTVIK